MFSLSENQYRHSKKSPSGCEEQCRMGIEQWTTIHPGRFRWSSNRFPYPVCHLRRSIGLCQVRENFLVYLKQNSSIAVLIDIVYLLSFHSSFSYDPEFRKNVESNIPGSSHVFKAFLREGKPPMDFQAIINEKRKSFDEMTEKVNKFFGQSSEPKRKSRKNS